MPMMNVQESMYQNGVVTTKSLSQLRYKANYIEVSHKIKRAPQDRNKFTKKNCRHFALFYKKPSRFRLKTKNVVTKMKECNRKVRVDIYIIKFIASWQLLNVNVQFRSVVFVNSTVKIGLISKTGHTFFEQFECIGIPWNNALVTVVIE